MLTRLTKCFISLSTSLIIYLFPPRFWSGNFFLIAPFPDQCLLLPLLFVLCYVVFCGAHNVPYNVSLNLLSYKVFLSQYF